MPTQPHKSLHLSRILFTGTLLSSMLSACGGSDNNDSEQTENSGDSSKIEVPFEAKGGDYGAVFNAWQLPYLLFPAEADNFIANGITYTLDNTADGGWTITMNGRHTTLNTQYNQFLVQRWRYSTVAGQAGIFEMYSENGSTALRLTYFDNGQVHQQQLANGDVLISEKWYLDNGTDIRIAYSAPDLASEITITDNEGSSALIYYGCQSAVTALLTMTTQTLSQDCSSNRSE